MRFKTHTYRFVVVGSLGFLFNSCVLFIFADVFGVNKIVAEIIGMLLSLQLTFALHENWTYTGKERTKHYHKPFTIRYVTYFVSNSFGSILTVVLFSIFSHFVANIVALAIASLISMLWNYAMNKIIVWELHGTK